MTTCELVVIGATHSVSKKLPSKCQLFFNKPNLLEIPYVVRSYVEQQDFLVFLDALHGRQHQITIENAPQLLNLCSEFGYAPLQMNIALLQQSHETCIIVPDDFSLRLTAIEEQRFHLENLSREIVSRMNDISSSQSEDRPKLFDSTPISAQTEKDNVSLSARKTALGSKFDAMKDFLKGKTKVELLFAARLLRKERNIEKVDRVAKRHRDALICWYCESCPDVLNANSVLLDILAQYHGTFTDTQAHVGFS
jgi:hypothetical protein